MMSGKETALILVLWFYLSCGTLGLLVQRHVQGDIFQNLGSGTGFCTQRNAVCSVLQLNGECEDSRMASEEASCPSCVCQNGFRYNAELDFCEEGTCPGYAGHEFFNQINQIRTMQQVLVVLVNLTFACPGTLHAWRYTLLTPRESTFFYLQVWRFVGAADSGEMVRVGSSRIDVAASSSPAEGTDTIHYLDASEQFPVEVGDFLGVFTLLGSQDIPIPSRRFSDLPGQFRTEAHVFQVTNGVLPTSLTLSERIGYEDNVGVNLHGVTGHANGEIDCINPAEVQATVVHQPTLTTQSTSMGNTDTVRDVLCTPTAGNCISTSQATPDGPTPTHAVPSQSWVVTTLAAGIVETPYLSPTFTTVGNNINGSVGDRRSEGEDSQSGYLNPVMISLISVSGVILLIVSTILMIVFLLWRRRSMDVKGRKPHEERTDSNSSPTSPAHPHQERADLNPAYYHVLTEDHPRSLSQQSLSSLKRSTTTLNIHIHYDSDQRLNSKSEQVFHIVVPTKDERELCHETRYSNGGPRSDEECILSQSNRQSLEDYFQETHQYWLPANSEDELYYQLAQNKYREILRKYISVGEVLGSGHFGSVQKGTWQTYAGPVEVAVKTLKSGLSEGEKVKFLQEAAIMGQFSHPNIIKLHGVVTVGEPVMIVLEMMSNGDLRNYLIKLRDSLGKPSSKDYPNMFLQFSRHIAAGMVYLSNKGFVHRDLAARNILLNGNMDCKIGDFGMARDLLEDNYYYMHGGPIPVKWTSPEALNSRKFTAASDVWSYGVVLYEVWSLGTKPFEFINNLEVISLVSEGHRLPPPPGCSKEMYRLMLDCWHPDPSQRPTFRDINELLSVEDDHLLTWQEAWHISGEACRSNQSSNQANLTTSEVTQYASIQNQLMV